MKEGLHKNITAREEESVCVIDQSINLQHVQNIVISALSESDGNCARTVRHPRVDIYRRILWYILSIWVVILSWWNREIYIGSISTFYKGFPFFFMFCVFLRKRSFSLLSCILCFVSLQFTKYLVFVFMFFCFLFFCI